MSSNKKIVGVCGSGQIGRNWAMLFAGAGYRVNLYDTNQEQVQNSLIELKKEFDIAKNCGILRGNSTAEEQLSLIHGVSSLQECMENAIHVQECVPESWQLKRKVFLEFDKYAGPDTVLSSSTSSIAPSIFTADVQHRDNCIVCHPITPPYIIRLVEIVPSPWTKAEVISRSRQLMNDIGQAPIVFKKEVLGFGVNRIQLSIMNECLSLLKEDVLDVADIETLMVEGLAPRYTWQGPFETAHLATNGIESSLKYFGPAFNSMHKTLKHDHSWDKADYIADLVQQMNKLTPLDQLQNRRQWREERLIELAKLKNKMNGNN